MTPTNDNRDPKPSALPWGRIVVAAITTAGVVLAAIFAHKGAFAPVINVWQSQQSAQTAGPSEGSREWRTLEAQVAVMAKRAEEAERMLREEREASRKQLERLEERLQHALQEKARSGRADSQPARTEGEPSAAKVPSATSRPKEPTVAPGPGTGTTSDAPRQRLQYRHQLFTFEVADIRVMDDEIGVALLYLNRTSSEQRGVVNIVNARTDTYLVDEAGRRYSYVRDSFGANRKFAPGVTEQVEIIFGKVKGEISRVDLVLDWVIIPPGNKAEQVVIRGVPILWQRADR